MGQINTNIKSHVQNEHARLKGAGDHLGLRQALQLESFEQYPIGFSHVSILFVMDADKDGRFSSEDLTAFAEFASRQTQLDETLDYGIQAMATLQLWQVLAEANGIDYFVDWFGRLLTFDRASLSFPQYPGILYLDGDAIKVLHELLNLRERDGMNLQSFMDMLQRRAEEKGLLSLEDEGLDDFVPLPIILEFVRQFAQGFHELMVQLGFKAYVPANP